MHCLCCVSLRVNAATSRTIARGMYCQLPSAATIYTPHLRYSAYIPIEMTALLLTRRTELRGASFRLSLVPSEPN